MSLGKQVLRVLIGLYMNTWMNIWRARRKPRFRAKRFCLIYVDDMFARIK